MKRVVCIAMVIMLSVAAFDQRMHDEACAKSSAPESAEGDYCTMCGREWCSVQINKELKEQVQ